MNKATHFIFGEYLVKTYMRDQPLCNQLAFLAGSVEPDINPVTYLRGFKTVQRWRGHNYRNVVSTIAHLAFDLDYTGRYDAHSFYYLGKLAHYSTDAFTFPHNATFIGKIRDHIRYEQLLRIRFTDFLKKDPVPPSPILSGKTVFSMIAQRHAAYMEAPTSLNQDISYTFTTVCVIVKILLDGFSPAALCSPAVAQTFA